MHTAFIKKIIFTLIICQLFLLLGVNISCYAGETTDSLISVLKKELKKKDQYDIASRCFKNYF